jgi:hypothetical protein
MAKRSRSTQVNVNTEAQRLYRSALGKGDLSTALHALRLVKESVPPPVGAHDPDPGLVASMNAEELTRLDLIFADMDALKNRVRERIRTGLIVSAAQNWSKAIEPPPEPLPAPIEVLPTPDPGPVLEPGEFIDADGKHWWKDPDDPNAEPMEYAEGDDD